MDYERRSNLFKALAHPVRLKMVLGLMNNRCNVNEIVKKLDMPQSTVSQHLGILRAQGIIVPKKDGVRTCYNVVSREVKAIVKILM